MNFNLKGFETFLGIVETDISKVWTGVETALAFLTQNQQLITTIINTIETIAPNAPGNKKLEAAKQALGGYLQVAGVVDTAANQIIAMSGGIFSAVKQQINATSSASTISSK